MELLLSTKKYAQSISIKTGTVAVSPQSAISIENPIQTVAKAAKVAKPTTVVKTAKVVKAAKVAKTKKASPSTKKDKLKITEFILTFLKSNDKVDSNAIIKAYSVYLNKTEDQVENNVANALSRLKSLSKVNNEPKADGKKKGTLWFLSKKL